MEGKAATRNVSEIAISLVLGRDVETVTGRCPWGGEDDGYWIDING